MGCSRGVSTSPAEAVRRWRGGGVGVAAADSPPFSAPGVRPDTLAAASEGAPSRSQESGTGLSGEWVAPV